MLHNNRVIFKDNTSLSDLSVSLSNYLSGTETLPIVALEDAVYLGSEHPFNHRWLEVSSPNANASVARVQIWNGEIWEDTVDMIDMTSVGGKSLAQSGIISWVPHKDRSNWSSEDTTEDIAELSTLKIYDLFWAKITFSQDLTNTTALKYVGHKFSSDEDLVSEYPVLADLELKDAFADGKTTWDDQHFTAAEYLIQDLKARSIVWSKDQVLDWQLFKTASVHKTAQIIFNALGDDNVDDMKQAAVNYKIAFNLKNFGVDVNATGKLEKAEKKISTAWMTR